MEQLDYSLTLFPHNRSSMTVPLFEDSGAPLTIEDIAESTSTIFSDLTYTAQLTGLESNLINRLEVFINGKSVDCVVRDGGISFPAKNGKGHFRIFLDCYGFVEISLVLELKTEEILQLRTGYIAVLVHKGALNDSVQAMVDHVYTHQEDLLLTGEAKSRNPSNVKEDGRKSLESQIVLAEKIAPIYESSYGYFKANARFKMCSRERVDSLEKLQQVAPATLRHIAQHPEQLRQTIGTAGIRIGKRNYQPQKTLVTQNEYSTDIYENQIIVSFLKQMGSNTQELSNKIQQILDSFPIKDEYQDEYVYSSFFIFSNTRKTLANFLVAVNKLTVRFKHLWHSYQCTLGTEEVFLKQAPKPTAIFLSIPHYNRIFVQIHQWFNYGIYDFEREKFMLSFIKISLLYESYILTKLIQYFKCQELEFSGGRQCHYPTGRRWKYENTKCNNTFVFSGNQQTMTIYYQPVIFDTDKSTVNQIGLYRNNTASLGSDDDGDRRGHYYVPDFLIKITRGGTNKYILCDAKFSTTNNTLNRYFPDLAYKYLLSISPITQNDVVSGLCIINGRELDGCRIRTAYDKQLEGRVIAPFAEILSLAEGIENEKHFPSLRKLFQLV